MNRILKTFALFLLVSTVSFVYAQDEIDDTRKGDKSVKDMSDGVKAGSGVKLDGVAKDPGSKPSQAKMAGHEEGKKAVLDDGKAAKKGSFWQSLFGKNKKVKKEEDPN
jgi:hypothetical protein